MVIVDKTFENQNKHGIYKNEGERETFGGNIDIDIDIYIYI